MFCFVASLCCFFLLAALLSVLLRCGSSLSALLRGTVTVADSGVERFHPFFRLPSSGKPHSFHLKATAGPDIYLSAGSPQRKHTEQHGHRPCVQARFGTVLMSAIWLVPPRCANPAGQTHSARVCVRVCGGVWMCVRVSENETEANQTRREDRRILTGSRL